MSLFFPVRLLNITHGSVRALCHVGTDSAVGSLLLQTLQGLALSRRAGRALMYCPFLPSGELPLPLRGAFATSGCPPTDLTVSVCPVNMQGTTGIRSQFGSSLLAQDISAQSSQ